MIEEPREEPNEDASAEEDLERVLVLSICDCDLCRVTLSWCDSASSPFSWVSLLSNIEKGCLRTLLALLALEFDVVVVEASDGCNWLSFKPKMFDDAAAEDEEDTFSPFADFERNTLRPFDACASAFSPVVESAIDAAAFFVVVMFSLSLALSLDLSVAAWRAVNERCPTLCCSDMFAVLSSSACLYVLCVATPDTRNTITQALKSRTGINTVNNNN